MTTLVHTLLARDRLLTLTAAAMLGGLVAVVVVAPWDARTITGINPWIKPAKFLSSIGLFLATMAWFMSDVAASARTRRILALTFVVAMVIEVVCIAGQAARGTTSHFNASTALNATIFQIMGIAITVNTVAAAVLLGLIRRDAPATRAGYLFGVRLGLMVFVLGSLQGFMIVVNKGHSVPGPDGGPGLPLVNWALDRGDLRVAHFIGLHALQILPLLGYLLDRRSTLSPLLRRVAVGGVAMTWLALMGIALAQAWRGEPLLVH